MVDGEKDPRNLMLLFQIDTVILREFNVVPQIEVSCTCYSQLIRRNCSTSRSATSPSRSGRRQMTRTASRRMTSSSPSAACCRRPQRSRPSRCRCSSRSSRRRLGRLWWVSPTLSSTAAHGSQRQPLTDQKDLLQTLTACFPVYGAQAVGERGDEFWDLIKTEVGSAASASSSRRSSTRRTRPSRWPLSARSSPLSAHSTPRPPTRRWVSGRPS